MTRDEAEESLGRLQHLLFKQPEVFDNAYRNLKSYIDDLDAEEEAKKAKKSFALEQIPQ